MIFLPHLPSSFRCIGTGSPCGEEVPQFMLANFSVTTFKFNLADQSFNNDM